MIKGVERAGMSWLSIQPIIFSLGVKAVEVGHQNRELDYPGCENIEPTRKCETVQWRNITQNRLSVSPDDDLLMTICPQRGLLNGIPSGVGTWLRFVSQRI